MSEEEKLGDSHASCGRVVLCGPPCAEALTRLGQHSPVLRPGGAHGGGQLFGAQNRDVEHFLRLTGRQGARCARIAHGLMGLLAAIQEIIELSVTRVDASGELFPKTGAAERRLGSRKHLSPDV